MADISMGKRHQSLLVFVALIIINIICIVTYMCTYQTKLWFFTSMEHSPFRDDYPHSAMAMREKFPFHNRTRQQEYDAAQLKLCADFLLQLAGNSHSSVLTSGNERSQLVIFPDGISVDVVRKWASQNGSTAATSCTSVFHLPGNITEKPVGKSISLDNKCFLHHIQTHHMPIIHNSLKIIQDLFLKEKIELILDSGSFIGSWRHHGPIPYDDDFDFRIWSDDKPRVRQLLEKMAANKSNRMIFADTEAINQHWKLGLECGVTKIPVSKCTWVVDFFFNWPCYDYASSENCMCFLEPPTKVPMSIVYPLVNRPFAGLIFQTYNNYAAYFKATYRTEPDVCKYYTHSAKSSCSTPVVPCDLIQYRFPFVLRPLTPVPVASNVIYPMELLVEKASSTTDFFIKSMFLDF